MDNGARIRHFRRPGSGHTISPDQTQKTSGSGHKEGSISGHEDFRGIFTTLTSGHPSCSYRSVPQPILPISVNDSLEPGIAFRSQSSKIRSVWSFRVGLGSFLLDCSSHEIRKSLPWRLAGIVLHWYPNITG